MGKPEAAVGSFSNWLFFRCVSLGMCVAGLAFVIANLRPLNLEFLTFGLLWTIISVAGCNDLIYGEADEEGIRYRQYFRRRFLGWKEIAIISWTNANVIHIHIKDRGRFQQILSAQSQECKSWSQLYSEEPQLIRWLTVAKPPTADGIELRDPAASMPALLRWDPRAVVRIFLFLIVVIGVILLFSTVHSLY
jgi:hypothetical protein